MFKFNASSLVSWLVNSNYNLVYADCPNASSLPKYIDIDAKEIRLLGSQKIAEFEPTTSHPLGTHDSCWTTAVPQLPKKDKR